VAVAISPAILSYWKENPLNAGDPGENEILAPFRRKPLEQMPKLAGG
jgi:hypothetical protein